MQEKNILSDMRLSTALVSIISSHLSEQSGLHRLSSHPPTVSTRPAASRTNPLCLYPRMSASVLGLALGIWNYETCFNC